jgi:hypothetical protein
VFLIEVKRRWVVLTKDGVVIIITSDKRVALAFAEKWKIKND